jgi:hypothetical protein
MTEVLATRHDALVDWLVHGLSGFSGGQIVAYTFVTTHIMIAAVTIFVHRIYLHCLLHRAECGCTTHPLAFSFLKSPRVIGRCL